MFIRFFILNFPLKVLAYRYDGLRESDVQRVSAQLKQDLSRQVGPRALRPAAATFNGWLDQLRANALIASAAGATAGFSAADVPSSLAPLMLPGDLPSSSSSGGGHATPEEEAAAPPAPVALARTLPAVARDAVAVLPLALFQPNDPAQLARLHGVLSTHAPATHYYLRQHIFPALMNFQATKISACGHELGSSILFGTRIGFSGTPSNLLPADLGDCQYEPGSDGKVVSVLTNPNVVRAETKPGWSARSLLRDVANAYDRTGSAVHALIDTGALITGKSWRMACAYRGFTS